MSRFQPVCDQLSIRAYRNLVRATADLRDVEAKAEKVLLSDGSSGLWEFVANSQHSKLVEAQRAARAAFDERLEDDIETTLENGKS